MYAYGVILLIVDDCTRERCGRDKRISTHISQTHEHEQRRR